jgi:hypothetical protein
MDKAKSIIKILPDELKLQFFYKICQLQFTSSELFLFILENPQYVYYLPFKNYDVLINDKGIRFEVGNFALDTIIFSQLTNLQLRNLITLLNNNSIIFKYADIDYFISDDISFRQVYPENLLQSGIPIKFNHISLYSKIKYFKMKHYDYEVQNILAMLDDPEFLSPWNYLFEIAIEQPQLVSKLTQIIKQIHERDENGNLLCTKVFKEVKFKITFCINIINNSWTSLLSEFTKFRKFYEENGYSESDLNVQLTLMVQNANDYLMKTNNLFNLIDPSFIENLKIGSVDSAYYNQDLTIIQKCKNLKNLTIILDLQCDLKTLGDLSNLKHLEDICFLCDNVDYVWLSNYLPKSVKNIQIFQSSFRKQNKNSFVVPFHVKTLIIECDDDKTIVDFTLIDFQKAYTLEKLVVYNRFNYNSTVEIYGLQTIPASLKVFAFSNVENSTFDDFSTHPLTATEFLVDCSLYNQLLGVYSNLDIRCDIHGQGIKFEDKSCDLHRITSEYMAHHKLGHEKNVLL